MLPGWCSIYHQIVRCLAKWAFPWKCQVCRACWGHCRPKGHWQMCCGDWRSYGMGLATGIRAQRYVFACVLDAEYNKLTYTRDTTPGQVLSANFFSEVLIIRTCPSCFVHYRPNILNVQDVFIVPQRSIRLSNSHNLVGVQQIVGTCMAKWLF